MEDKEILDMIEDLLANEYGEDDALVGSEAMALLDRIVDLVESREGKERGHRNNPDYCAKCNGVCQFDSDGNPKPQLTR